MLTVLTPDEAFSVIKDAFPPRPVPETVALSRARGRVLCAPVESREYVPGFDRSSVDGYAVAAADTFGCSDAIPALLTLTGEVSMGQGAGEPLPSGCCRYVPTGGAVPQGADAVVMMEYCERFGSDTVGVGRPAAPGENMVFRGDDVYPGKVILPAGRLLGAQDIGALAALGVTEVTVCRRPRVGILSTGDELVPAEASPGPGQVRDVNSAMLQALVEEAGGEARPYGILPDEEPLLRAALKKAAAECDMVLLSGGSSVGTKDAACRVIAGLGEILFHGIAMKPGKPTILGRVDGKPVFGLPGHPVAAFFVSRLFVRFALLGLMGREARDFTVSAELTESVSANHGRAQYNGASLFFRNGRWYARPIRGKSGLITTLSDSDGFFCVPRDREGFAQGETIPVTLYTIDQEV
ncbi:MAG: gephyrin-like molybdotransferase Glp [Oscillospiraceae bacterium]